MKKVLVTGGAGFIGSHTVDLLLQNQIPVRVLDNFSSGHRSNLPDAHPGLEVINGDITDREVVIDVMAGISHCLHLAAQVSVVASLEDPLHSAQQNIVGFVNVLNAAQTHEVKRLVYASSAAIYGQPERIPLAEDAVKVQLSPYGLEKNVNEEYAALYERIYGFSSLGQRYFNVYGPRQDPASPYAGVIALFVDRISNGKSISIFGDGNQTRDFIFVKDVAQANFAALDSRLNGACNIGTGRQTSLRELVSILSKIIGSDCDINYEPVREGDIRDSLAVVQKMNQDLGITAATSIEEGLTELVRH